MVMDAAETDYTAVADFTLTITAGQSSGTATFSLTPTADDLDELDETLTVDGTVQGLEVEAAALTVAAIGLEAGPLSQWLHKGLTDAGFETVLMETRQVKAALKAMPIKTDRRDAEGIARLLQMGWFRPVHCKTVSSQEMRALLTSRKSILDALLKMGVLAARRATQLRPEAGPGVSKVRYEARVRELIAGNAMPEAAAEPILRARADLRRELAGLEKILRNLMRQDPVCRLLIVVRHRRLTPRNRSESRPYHADRSLIRALNNTAS